MDGLDLLFNESNFGLKEYGLIKNIYEYIILMTKKCLTCKSTVIDDLESDMENEIPLWYKKAGNYSLLPSLLNCNDEYNPNKEELKEKTPSISEIEVKIPIQSEKNTWVFYWASLPLKDIEIKKPEEAYGDESNSGLLKTDKSGKTTLILNCPQPYRVNNITYPRHVHYTTLTEDNVWSDEIKTLVVYCHLDKEQFTKALQSKDHIIINALSEEEHEKMSIPETYNLPIENINPSNRNDKVEDFIESHLQNFKTLTELIENNKLDKKDIPIITYSEGPTCNASKELAKHIMNTGYSNVVEYPGGTYEWFNDDNNSDDEGDTFFNDNKYDLNNKYETIIMDGIKYKHKLDELNYILDEDDQILGRLVDDKIIWDNENDMDNEFLSDTSSDDEKEEKEEKEEKSSDDEEEEKEETSSDNEEDEKEETSSDDEEEEKEETSSDNEEDEKEETSSDDEEEEKEETSSNDEKEEKENKKGGGNTKLEYDGIYICDGGRSITKKEYNKLFRGWGFSFL